MVYETSWLEVEGVEVCDKWLGYKDDQEYYDYLYIYKLVD